MSNNDIDTTTSNNDNKNDKNNNNHCYYYWNSISISVIWLSLLEEQYEEEGRRRSLAQWARRSSAAPPAGGAAADASTGVASHNPADKCAGVAYLSDCLARAANSSVAGKLTSSRGGRDQVKSEILTGTHVYECKRRTYVGVHMRASACIPRGQTQVSQGCQLLWHRR